MSWFNLYGLIIMIIMMLPNIIYSFKNKEGFENHFKNKGLEITEQIGRYSTFILMIFNIPFTYIGWIFNGAELVYFIVNFVLLASYILIWVIMHNKNNIIRAILLSVIPSVIFIFSGIMILSILLIISSIVFSICHITISVKNANYIDKSPNKKRNTIITSTSLALSIVLLGIIAYANVIISSIIPFIEAYNMTASEMLDYDVKNSNNIISVAVIKDGKTTYYTYGSKAIDGQVYDYEIGSISKTMLGLIYSKLESENKVSLNDSISKYLDLDKNTYYPTIERLLTHTSGYSSYYFESPMIFNKLSQTTTNDFYGITKTTLLSRVQKTKLKDQDYPFCYSNFGISVLGLVLEKIYDKSYTEIINEYMLNELNLTNTKAAKQSGNLKKYWKWKDNDAYIPAGSIVSNITDMAKQLTTCLEDNGYIANSFKALKEVDANNKTYLQYGIRIDSVGMTWMRDEENGYIWHNGATTDFNSYFAFDREKHVGVVLLGNLSPSKRITLTVVGAKLINELTTENN